MLRWLSLSIKAYTFWQYDGLISFVGLLPFKSFSFAYLLSKTLDLSFCGYQNPQESVTSSEVCLSVKRRDILLASEIHLSMVRDWLWFYDLVQQTGSYQSAKLKTALKLHTSSTPTPSKLEKKFFPHPPQNF